MSLTDTGILRNEQTKQQLLRGEADWCERQAFILRQDAARLTEQASIYEAEARVFRAQLQSNRAPGTTTNIYTDPGIYAPGEPEAPQQKCTCTPAKSEVFGKWAIVTFPRKDPCCPVHRSVLIGEPGSVGIVGNKMIGEGESE